MTSPSDTSMKERLRKHDPYIHLTLEEREWQYAMEQLRLEAADRIEALEARNRELEALLEGF